MSGVRLNHAKSMPETGLADEQLQPRRTRSRLAVTRSPATDLAEEVRRHERALAVILVPATAGLAVPGVIDLKRFILSATAWTATAVALWVWQRKAGARDRGHRRDAGTVQGGRNR